MQRAPDANMTWAEWFHGRRALITGGLGFIGSNLARRLVALGAQVRIVDAALPGSGANPHNLDGLEHQVEAWRADLRNGEVVTAMLIGQDVLFNLAAQVGHLASMEDPVTDLAINASCQLAIVEACRRVAPEIRVVHTATRQFYGRTSGEPTDETHPIAPVDYNGVSKRAGELYHLVAHQVYGLRATSLRLTNTYGPRMRCRDGRQTFLGEWVRCLLKDEPLLVYGDGMQVRDLNHVDDVVTALLATAASSDTIGQAYNLGGREPIRLVDLAGLMIGLAGRGRIAHVPFPGARRRIEIGDYLGDYTRIATTIGWQPTIDLRAGLRGTLDFFETQREHYL